MCSTPTKFCDQRCEFPNGPQTKEQKNIEESGMARCGQDTSIDVILTMQFPAVQLNGKTYAVVALDKFTLQEFDGALLIRWTDQSNAQG